MSKAIERPQHVINTDADLILPDPSWSVVEHIRRGMIEWDPVRVELYLSESQRGILQIKGTRLRKKLADQPVLNYNVFVYLFRHQELIPEEWKWMSRRIYFWGTIFSDTRGNLRVSCLYWDLEEAKWCWSYSWLDNDWCEFNPAAVLIKT